MVTGLELDFFYILLGAVSLLIAVSDFLFYKIPNFLVLVLIVLFLLKVLLFQELKDLTGPSMAFLSVIVIGFFLYHFKMFGAGDVKFFAVFSAWALDKEEFIMGFIFIAFFGALLAVIYLTFPTHIEILRNIGKRWAHKFFVLSSISEETKFLKELREKKGKKRIIIPYGVAVAAGCLKLVITHLMNI
jgi:prepilin peptidase CpaA